MREQCRGREQLGRGSGLERIGEGGGARRKAMVLACCEASASSSPLVGSRKTTSPPSAFIVAERIRQAPLRDLLQLGIDGEHHVVAGHRLTYQPRGRVVPSAGSILQEHRFARLPRENGVQRKLQPGRTDIPFGRESANDGTGERTRGIESLELACEMHTIEPAKRLDLGGRERTVQIDPPLSQPQSSRSRAASGTAS